MFNSYEELQAAVEKRRNDELVLSIDMSTEYSPEHESAKAELKKAEAMKSIAGDQPFINDNIKTLEARVKKTQPAPNLVFVKYRRLALIEWAALVKAQNLTPIEQYEKVLKKTFVGVFASEDAEEPLSDDHRLLSTKGDLGILPGGGMNSVVNAFMTWQNTGGSVAIRPTKSGRA